MILLFVNIILGSLPLVYIYLPIRRYLGIPLNFLFAMNFGKLLARMLYNFVATKNNSYHHNWPIVLSIFPVISVLVFYTIGVLTFGVIRQRDLLDSFIFPLDFTVAGLGSVSPTFRILYAIYLEMSVILIGVVIALLQLSNSVDRINNSFDSKNLLTQS